MRSLFNGNVIVLGDSHEAGVDLNSEEASSIRSRRVQVLDNVDATIRSEVSMASRTRANEPLNAKQLQVSGILLILGLLIEALTLVWNHPISFWVFLFVGGGFLLSGIMVFLYTFIVHFLRARRD